MDRKAARKQPRHDTSVSGLSRIPQVPCAPDQIRRCGGGLSKPCDLMRRSLGLAATAKQGNDHYQIAQSQRQLDGQMTDRGCIREAKKAIRDAAASRS